MTDSAVAEPQNETSVEGAAVEQQAAQQTGKQSVRLRVNQNSMTTSYANAFRSGVTAEEVLLDFGLNQVVQTRPADQEEPNGPVGEILFEVNNRIVLNYFTAKRLAVTLGQVVRRYEDQFGELKLNVADRAKSS